MGRPSYQPSSDDRVKVAALVVARVSLEKIAQQLGITKKTLVKHFPVELGRETCGITPEEKPEKRPVAYTVTPDQREVVEILAASKIVGLDEIADRLGITVEMLQYHFADELKRGPAKRNTEVLIAIQKGAAAGSAAQQRLWVTITGGAVNKSSANPKAAPLGKKEQADAQAMRAVSAPGSKFAPPAPPRLVVNNEN